MPHSSCSVNCKLDEWHNTFPARKRRSEILGALVLEIFEIDLQRRQHDRAAFGRAFAVDDDESDAFKLLEAACEFRLRQPGGFPQHLHGRSVALRERPNQGSKCERNIEGLAAEHVCPPPAAAITAGCCGRNRRGRGWG